MEPGRAQAIIRRLREEIRRREGTALPGGGPGALASGFAPLDGLLPGGGFPLGRVVELTGTRASGKTTLALLALARATGEGRLAAFVDPLGELYPPAAAALGVELSRLLLVRPREPSLCARVASLLARSGAFAAVVTDVGALGRQPPGPISRRLLEAAETGRAALLLLSERPSPLDTSLRIGVERTGELELELVVQRSRLGPPGRTARGRLPCPDAADPAPCPAPRPLRRLRAVAAGEPG